MRMKRLIRQPLSVRLLALLGGIALSAILAGCSGTPATDAILEASSGDEIAADENTAPCNPLLEECAAEENAACSDLAAEASTLEDRLALLEDEQEMLEAQLLVATGSQPCPTEGACADVRRAGERQLRRLTACRREYEDLQREEARLREAIDERLSGFKRRRARAEEVADQLAKNGSHAESYREACERSIESAVQVTEGIDDDLPEASEALGDAPSEQAPGAREHSVTVGLDTDERATPETIDVEGVEAASECTDIADHLLDLRTKIAAIEAENAALESDLARLATRRDAACTATGGTCTDIQAWAAAIDEQLAACEAGRDRLDPENEEGTIAELEAILASLGKEESISTSWADALRECANQLFAHRTWASGEEDVILPPIEEAQKTPGFFGTDKEKSVPYKLTCPDDSVLAGLAFPEGKLTQANILCRRWSADAGLSTQTSWAGRAPSEAARGLLDNQLCPAGYAINGLMGHSRKKGGIAALSTTCVRVGTRGVELMRAGGGDTAPLAIYHNTVTDRERPTAGIASWGDAPNVWNVNVYRIHYSTTLACPGRAVARGIAGRYKKDRVLTMHLLCDAFEYGELAQPIAHSVPAAWDDADIALLPDDLFEALTTDEKHMLTASPADDTELQGWSNLAMVGVRMKHGNNRVAAIAPVFVQLSQVWKPVRTMHHPPELETINGETEGGKEVRDLLCPPGHVVTGTALNNASRHLLDSMGLRCSPLVDGGWADLDHSVWTRLRPKRGNPPLALCGGDRGRSRSIAVGLEGTPADGKEKAKNLSHKLGLKCAQLNPVGQTIAADDGGMSNVEYRRRRQVCREEGWPVGSLQSCIYNESRWE